MADALQFLLRHGYAVLFAWVLAEQLGFPLPAIPILLAAGALAGAGQMNLALALALAMAAALTSDTLWYQLGRRRGARVLEWLCRISLEPDSCVRKTENLFGRHGPWALLYAKFIPGLNTVAPPLAGVFQLRLSRFLAYDAAGALLWAGAFAGLGYLFSDQLERVATYALGLGSGSLALVGGGFVGWLAWKYVERQRFLRELHIARISPEELLAKIEAGEGVVVVDLRHRVEFEADGEKLLGALHLDPNEIENRHQEIPRDRDVVLYCT